MSIKFFPLAFLFSAFLSGCGQGSSVTTGTEIAPQQYKENVHYQVLQNKADRPSDEILEFFWLGCPHCYSASPSIKELVKTSKNKPVLTIAHSQLYEQWINDAGLFYAINHLTNDPDVIESYFIMRHTGKMKTNNDFNAFLSEHNLSLNDINESLKNPSVIALREQMSSIEKSISAKGVPAFLVGGKYIVNLENSYGKGKWDDVAAVIDYLVEKSKSE